MRSHLLSRLSITLLAAVLVSCSTSSSNSDATGGFALVDRLAALTDQDDRVEIRDVVAATDQFGGGDEESDTAWVGRVGFDSWGVATDDEWIEGIGIDRSKVTWAAMGGPVPHNYVLLVGDIDRDAVVDSLGKRDPSPSVEDDGEWTLLDFPGEELKPHVLPIEPMNGYGRAQRFAVRDGYLVASNEADVRARVVDAFAGTSREVLVDHPGIAALRDVVSAEPPVLVALHDADFSIGDTLGSELLAAADVVYAKPTPSVGLLLAYASEQAATIATDQIRSWRAAVLELPPPQTTLFLEPTADVWEALTVRHEGSVVVIDLGDTAAFNLLASASFVVGMRCATEPAACDEAAAS